MLALSLIILSTYSWVIFLNPKKESDLNLKFFAQFFIVFYILFFASAYPLVFLERWSLMNQVSLALAFSVFPIYHSLKLKKFSRPRVRLNPKLIFIMVLGVFLQWRSIYYFYSTHDPAIYIAQAVHIARTGTFFHRNSLYVDNSILKDTVAIGKPEQRWESLENFGLLPVDGVSGVSSFHGFFGAPLFFSAVIQGWGEKYSIRANILHFIAASIFITFLGLRFSRRSFSKTGEVFPLLLFSICPLIPLVFRMAISEPLAIALFLGMVICSLSCHQALSRLGFVGILIAALTTRISALLYLPFAFCFLSFYSRRIEKIAILILTTLAIALAFHFSPHYFMGITKTHLQQVLHRSLLDYYIYFSWGLFWTVNALLLFFGRSVYLYFSNSRKKIWFLVVTLWILGIGARYGRLFYRGEPLIGGFPFTAFNFDGLVFYACPVLALGGILYWLSFFKKHSQRSFFFLESFAPFCFIFYTVVLFGGANTLQVYHFRYITIELIPLCVLGFCLWLSQLTSSHLKTALLTFTISWLAGLTYSLNKSEICKDSYQALTELKDINGVSTAEPSALLVKKMKWIDYSHLVPLFTAYNVPIFLVSDENENTVTAALVQKGVRPIVVARAPQSSTEGFLKSTFKGCHQYSYFSFLAPPSELETYCTTLYFSSPRLKPRLADKDW